MKIRLLSVILAVAALPFIACGNDSRKAESTPSSTAGRPASAATPAVTRIATTVATVAPTRQSALSSQEQIGDLLLTVNGASLYADSALPAAAGTHYVAIEVTAKNLGSQNYVLNVLDFSLKDSGSNIHGPAITNGPQPQIGSFDSVAPGQVERGFIVFPLGDGSDPVELQYKSPTGTSGALAVPKPAT